MSKKPEIEKVVEEFRKMLDLMMATNKKSEVLKFDLKIKYETATFANSLTNKWPRPKNW